MTKKRKSAAGLMVAIVSPFVLYALGLREWGLFFMGIVTTILFRLMLDLIWPDKETDS